MSFAPGTKLGAYEITGHLGQGGMGVVLRARDTRLNCGVAIKVLPEDGGANPERKRRFLEEARAASALNHPNIVTIHDIGCEAGSDFIVMELVSGETLAASLAGGRLGAEAALGLARFRSPIRRSAAADGPGVLRRETEHPGGEK